MTPEQRQKEILEIVEDLADTYQRRSSRPMPEELRAQAGAILEIMFRYGQSMARELDERRLYKLRCQCQGVDYCPHHIRYGQA